MPNTKRKTTAPAQDLKKELAEEKKLTAELRNENNDLLKQLIQSQGNFAKIRRNYDNEKVRLNQALNTLNNITSK